MVDESAVRRFLLGERSEDSLVFLVHVLDWDFCFRCAADEPNETDEEDYGVDNVSKADDDCDAVKKRTGGHQVLSELRVVHYVRLHQSLDVLNHADEDDDEGYDADDG